MNTGPDASSRTFKSSMTFMTRTSSVILGHLDFSSVLLRLIGMELYKIRRRVMSKVLGSIAITVAILVFLFVSLGTVFVLNGPAETFAPCVATGPNGQAAPGQGTPATGPGLPNSCPQYTAAQLAQMKQDALRNVSEPLRLPNSLNFVSEAALGPATILIIILIGSIAGGEFNIGTVRLMFTRGPMRGQFLLAKYGAALVCIIITVLAMTFIGILTGEAVNPISGISQTADFLSPGWVGHALLYLLVVMLNWFIYAVIAVFFGTLGRSTVAGIVGALTWFFAEPIVTGVLGIAALFNKGPLGDFLKAIPDYLTGSNISALEQNQGQYLFGGSAAALSDLHAVIVLAVYLAAFIGLTWWLNESRDITN